MQDVSHREYLLWMTHLELEWNRPDRHDNYVMALIAAVKSVLRKKPANIDDQQIKFVFEKPGPKKPLSPGEVKRITKQAKAGWFGMVGVTRKKK